MRCSAALTSSGRWELRQHGVRGLDQGAVERQRRLHVRGRLGSGKQQCNRLIAVVVVGGGGVGGWGCWWCYWWWW